MDEDLLKVQKALTNLGLDPDPADGIYRKKTKAALEEFQQEKGLMVTGKADTATKELLLN